MELILKALTVPSGLEWAAIIMTAVCIFLAGRNNVHTWWTGIVACVLFGWLFYTSQLYADVTLQGFFIVTGFIGWMTWNSQAARRAADTAPPTHADRPFMVKALAGSVMGALIYGALLYKFTDAWAPFVDSFVMTFSIMGQILLMRRQVETWPVWIVVNILSVPLYASRELYVTSAMYFVFLLNAGYSWYHWRKLMAK